MTTLELFRSFLISNFVLETEKDIAALDECKCSSRILAIISSAKDLMRIDNLELRKILIEKHPEGWRMPLDIDSTKIGVLEMIGLVDGSPIDPVDDMFSELNDAINKHNAENIKYYSDVLKLGLTQAEIGRLTGKTPALDSNQAPGDFFTNYQESVTAASSSSSSSSDSYISQLGSKRPAKEQLSGRKNPGHSSRG